MIKCICMFSIVFFCAAVMNSSLRAQEVNHLEFIETAVKNGLVEDGVPRSEAEAWAAEKALFVEKCKICDSTKKALKNYGALGEQPDGKGLSLEFKNGFASEKADVRLDTFRKLIQSYIERAYVREHYSEVQIAAMQKALDKEGMASSRYPKTQPFCASCLGVCRKQPTTILLPPK